MSYFYFLEGDCFLYDKVDVIKLVVATRCEMIHWLNKVIEYNIHDCNLNGKDNDLSYYLIHLGPFCTCQLCMFQLFLRYVITMEKH